MSFTRLCVLVQLMVKNPVYQNIGITFLFVIEKWCLNIQIEELYFHCPKIPSFNIGFWYIVCLPQSLFYVILAVIERKRCVIPYLSLWVTWNNELLCRTKPVFFVVFSLPIHLNNYLKLLPLHKVRTQIIQICSESSIWLVFSKNSWKIGNNGEINIIYRWITKYVHWLNWRS